MQAWPQWLSSVWCVDVLQARVRVGVCARVALRHPAQLAFSSRQGLGSQEACHIFTVGS